MKNRITIFLMLLTFSMNGQNLFFIGEKSFPCTQDYVLKPNSDKFFINELNIKFAKDKENKILALSTKTENVGFSGKLIIYLDNGDVITTSREKIFDYVDKIALAIYYLTNDDLKKLKNSNINTVKYTLKDEYGDDGAFGGNFSASNKSKVDFSEIISEFYEK
ncbi:hypothetical protein LB467_12745 [Salegentibacter sp. JZCK2]|uniref:hypothetical protein n=1 Tax=Salegentibacter tibetensis TaxID=2873600 RepID=UPI001CCBA2D1|nr:hypothetical protein [Salegentibacter tibetensis]MBZ9730555.1 hypothetical protein [Salegentibacter tibetensis]